MNAYALERSLRPWVEIKRNINRKSLADKLKIQNIHIIASKKKVGQRITRELITYISWNDTGTC